MQEGTRVPMWKWKIDVRVLQTVVHVESAPSYSRKLPLSSYGRFPWGDSDPMLPHLLFQEKLMVCIFTDSLFTVSHWFWQLKKKILNYQLYNLCGRWGEKDATLSCLHSLGNGDPTRSVGPCYWKCGPVTSSTGVTWDFRLRPHYRSIVFRLSEFEKHWYLNEQRHAWYSNGASAMTRPPGAAPPEILSALGTIYSLFSSSRVWFIYIHPLLPFLPSQSLVLPSVGRGHRAAPVPHRHPTGSKGQQKSQMKGFSRCFHSLSGVPSFLPLCLLHIPWGRISTWRVPPPLVILLLAFSVLFCSASVLCPWWYNRHPTLHCLPTFMEYFLRMPLFSECPASSWCLQPRELAQVLPHLAGQQCLLFSTPRSLG